MEKVILIYLIANSFLAGRQWEKDNEKETHHGVQWTLFVFAMIFGIALYSFFFIQECIKWFFETTQIRFWFNWYFRSMYNLKPAEPIIAGLYSKLEQYAAKQKLSWADHHLVYCIYKVFKKHNINLKPNGTN